VDAKQKGQLFGNRLDSDRIETIHHFVTEAAKGAWSCGKGEQYRERKG